MTSHLFADFNCANEGFAGSLYLTGEAPVRLNSLQEEKTMSAMVVAGEHRNQAHANSFNRPIKMRQSEIHVEELHNRTKEITSLLLTASRILDVAPDQANTFLRQAAVLLEAAGPEAELLEVARPQLVQGGLAPWQYRNVVAHVELHLTCAIRVEDLASLCRLSVSHFSRAFKVSFGEAPYSYIISKRVELAQTLMLTTEEPLSQIAQLCGLADQAHLSNLFRRCVGCTPFEWRRRNRSDGRAAYA